MSITARARTASLPTLILAAAIAGAVAAGAPAGLAAQAPDAVCVYYETPYKQATLVVDADGSSHCQPNADAAAAEARAWPNFDSTAFGDRVEMVEAATQEAALWPDFDPSDMTQEVAATEARQEAANWPNFDTTDMTQEVAATEARQEAASWPNFDSTSIDTTTHAAANSPRMTQIAASEPDAVDAAVTRGPLTAF